MADTYQAALDAQVKFAQEKGLLRTPNPTFSNPVTSTSPTDWASANTVLPYFEEQGVSAESHRAGIAIAKAALGPNPSTKVTQMLQEAAARPDEAVARYRDQNAGADRIAQMSQAERERAESHLLTFTQRTQQELADPAYSARQVEGLQNSLARHNGLAAFDVSPDLQRLAYQSYRDVHAVMSHYLSTGDAQASAHYASNLAKSRDVQHLTNLHNDAIRMEAGESSLYGGATGYSQFHTSRALEAAEHMLNAEGTSARLGSAYFANNFNRLVVDAVMDGVRQEHGAGAVFHDTKSAQGLRELGSHVAERMNLSFVPNPEGRSPQELAQQVVTFLNEQNGGKSDFRVEHALAQAASAAKPSSPVATAEATGPAHELAHEPAHVPAQAPAQAEPVTAQNAASERVEPTFTAPETAAAHGPATGRVEPTFAQAEPVATPSTPAPAAHARAESTAAPTPPAPEHAQQPVQEPTHEHAHEHAHEPAPAPEHTPAAASPAATPDPAAAVAQRRSELEGVQKHFADALERIQPTVLKQGMLGDGVHELRNPVLANGTGMGLSANVHGFNLAGAEDLHAIHVADVAVARASLGANPLNTVQKLVQEAATSLPHHALAQEYAGLSESMRERVQFSAEEKAHFATFGPSQADAAKSVFESSPDLQRLAFHSYADAYSVVTQHIHSGAEEAENYAQRLALMRDIEHVAALKADAHQVAAGEASRFAGEHGYAQFHTSRAVESIAKMVKEMPDDYAWDKHSINALVGEAVREGLAHEHGMGLSLHNAHTAEGLNALIDHTANRMALDGLPNPNNLSRTEQVLLGAEGFYPKGVEFKPLEKVGPTMDLSGQKVEAVAQTWSLNPGDNQPPGINGRTLSHAGDVDTTPIVGVDPKTQRVLTETGEVYELGAPHVIFGARHPELLREAGVSVNNASLDLSGLDVKAVAHNWAFHQLKGRTADAPGAIGQAMVFGDNDFQTTPIVGVDPNSRRILTKSGSVYELGNPKMDFAVKNPTLMSEVGLGGLNSALSASEHAAAQSPHAVAAPTNDVPHTAPVSPAPVVAEVAETTTHAAEAADIAKTGLRSIAKDAFRAIGMGPLGDALALEDFGKLAGRVLEFTSGGGKVGMYGALATGVGKETEVIQNVFDKTGVTAHVNQHASEAHNSLESGMAKVSEWARPVTDQYHKAEQVVEPKIHAVTDYVGDKAAAVGHTLSHHVDNVAHAASSRLEPVTTAIGHALSPVTEPVLHAATEFAQAHKSSVDAVMHVGENVTGIAMTDLAKGAPEHPQTTSVQTALNQALKAAGHEGTPLSAQEAQTVAAELRHVQPGDSLAIEKNGNIHLVPAGTQVPKFPEGATHVDAEALREAAGITRAPAQVASLESTHGNRER